MSAQAGLGIYTVVTNGIISTGAGTDMSVPEARAGDLILTQFDHSNPMLVYNVYFEFAVITDGFIRQHGAIDLTGTTFTLVLIRPSL